MYRGSTAEFQTEVTKSQNMPVHCVSVHLDDYSLHMTDSDQSIEFGGNEYLGLGKFSSVSDIEESSQLIVSSMTLSLSGVNQEWISIVLNEEYIDRQVKVYTGFLDVDTHVLITNPVLIFDGRIDAPIISENPDGKTSTVSISVTNAWVDFTRRTGRHANNEEQQALFPGDKGFEFASQNITDLVWGEKP